MQRDHTGSNYAEMKNMDIDSQTPAKKKWNFWHFLHLPSLSDFSYLIEQQKNSHEQLLQRVKYQEQASKFSSDKMLAMLDKILKNQSAIREDLTAIQGDLKLIAATDVQLHGKTSTTLKDLKDAMKIHSENTASIASGLVALHEKHDKSVDEYREKLWLILEKKLPELNKQAQQIRNTQTSEREKLSSEIVQVLNEAGNIQKQLREAHPELLQKMDLKLKELDGIIKLFVEAISQQGVTNDNLRLLASRLTDDFFTKNDDAQKRLEDIALGIKEANQTLCKQADENISQISDFNSRTKLFVDAMNLLLVNSLIDKVEPITRDSERKGKG